MRVDSFDFVLPETLIADRPVSPRESAKLLVVRDSLSDHTVGDLPDFLEAGDVLVFNDTRVIPARLRGMRRTAKIEVTLHKNVSLDTWHAFAKPAKKLKPGDEISFGDDFKALVADKFDGGEVALAFNFSGADLMQKLSEYGEIPLPPYIGSIRQVDEQDKKDYQTIFANEEGAVAAPTAGLHFTPALMEQIKAKGVVTVATTLHVGAGTFLPVKVEDTDDHKMHAEYGVIRPDAAEIINACRKKGGRVVSVGTTSLRLLESAADDYGIVHPFQGETDIFITPGYRFKAVDLLMTNFHLPKSTLFMLVSAFSGFDRMKEAYGHAIDEKYRFYSYGDSSLLYPAS
ncbi:tRNA preQ1(34) S-adenosylmethionine ribosyltransferase-isomerase QueA [Sneathiella chinensis]|uniref:S-adenosylmethionine:tRNA ribosyltransferase-isomerase n=1 Tax=Sneathiella chinensis TaxID=349750 RepID=A0ABQ5U6B4_9PROT|nr:tRNA preQ1(34) S-adenosylmethionine ribosyltransferase-isomerase QueA [Sneathiella chinensis]GLQ07433.1 S-adenosylmethionine:tRNA ribosyltransferase-isomerase [Sneathiella chinensis]